MFCGSGVLVAIAMTVSQTCRRTSKHHLSKPKTCENGPWAIAVHILVAARSVVWLSCSSTSIWHAEVARQQKATANTEGAPIVSTCYSGDVYWPIATDGDPGVSLFPLLWSNRTSQTNSVYLPC